MFLLNGKPLLLDTPFTHEGIQYPAVWLRISTAAEKEAIGIVEVPDPIIPDSRFYYIDYLGNSILKDLNTIKNELNIQIDQSAKSFLTQTDWYIIRKMDIGTEVPDDVKTYRDQVRQILASLEESIKNASSAEELQTIANNINSQWPTLEN